MTRCDTYPATSGHFYPVPAGLLYNGEYNTLGCERLPVIGPCRPDCLGGDLGVDRWKLPNLGREVQERKVLIVLEGYTLRSMAGQDDLCPRIDAVQAQPGDKRRSQGVPIHGTALIVLKRDSGPLQIPLERPERRSGLENPVARLHKEWFRFGYLVARALARAWAELDITVGEGLDQLKTLCSIEVRTPDGGSCLRIPEPRETSRALLQALDLHLPEALPHTEVRVVTRKKPSEHRKKR